MTELQENVYEKRAFWQVEQNRPEGPSLSQEEENAIRESLDLNGRFLDTYRPFFMEKNLDDITYCLYSELDGISSFMGEQKMYLYIDFYPSRQVLVFNDMDFVLKK